jgi:hypothetical protein
MPSSSEKQRRFMGAELTRKRSGKRTSTGMSEQQLREFAGSVQQGSLEDITYHEEAAERDTVLNGSMKHPIHKGYDCVVFGNDRGWKEDGDEPKGSEMSANRDNGYGVHYGAPVDYFGPDTNYRAEEIDPHQYGRDWEPIPLRDYYKSEDKQFDRGLRMREQDEYDQTRTPGTVTDSQPQAEAYGAVNWDGAGPDREIEDYRSFDNQRRFARSSKDKGQEYAVDISGHDTKSGKKIR